MVKGVSQMNIQSVSNKQSFHPGHHTGVSARQEQSDKEIIIKKVDREVWSIECTIEELVLDLSRAVENIASLEDNSLGTKTLTVHKYDQQARDLMRWIPIARPVPEFVINANDLSPDMIREIESRLDDLPTLAYILKQAVGRIFENLGHAYFHLSIARNLRVRIEP
jgi:hypothetical protein